jgi:uncharacterized protein YjbI with pentapeptide repeats
VVYVAAQRYLYSGDGNPELDLEDQRAQDTAVQTYLDQMSNLMIDRRLRKTDPDSDERALAQARTLAILLQLGAERKRLPLKLVAQMHLIDKDSPIIKLPHADLVEADLTEVTLVDVDLTDVDLRGANLTDANLGGTVLADADLRSADLTGADLTSTVLSGANLRGANLRGADLRGADLRDADLEAADLSGADLGGAGLSGAYLSYANLDRATDITSEELAQHAYSLEGATMPNGQKYEDWFKDKEDR